MEEEVNAAAVDAVALRETRAEIRRLRADIRALLPLALVGSQAMPSQVEQVAAEQVLRRARKALNRRSP